MKKLTLLFLLAASLFAADVQPFYFPDIPAAEQQATWDELMKYKLWGTEAFSIGGNSKIPDESGRNGTTGNLTGTGNETLLGGPIFADGNITVGYGYTFPTGPTVADTFTIGGLNNGYFGGTLCLADTNVSDGVKTGLVRGGGELSNDCGGYPKPTGLKVPEVTWPDSTYPSITVGLHGQDTVQVPDGEGPYDIYLSGITMGDESFLYFAVPDTGRLVRVFVKGEISLGNHAVIQTMNNGTPIPNDEYMGNLLFYTTEDMVFDNTDYCIRQGTYISAKTFKLLQQVTFAGQLLANNLAIGNNVDGKNFLFVSFDNPKINLGDPQTNALGNFVENNQTVEIPIYLDTLAPSKVTFNYCFILNESATIEDFNTEAAPIPVCDVNEGKVTILEGTSTPETPVYVNVVDDGIVEGLEVVGLKIYNVSGASLPGNKRSHVFTLTLTDSEYKNTAPVLDKDQKFESYLEEQPIPPGSGYIGKVTVTDDRPADLKFSMEDPSGYFIIDELTGEVKTTKVFDYETEDTVYVVTIKVTDGEFADSASYEIKIGNVQEDITATVTLSDVYEGPLDSIGGAVIGTVVGKDADSTKVSYKITDASNTFAIDENGSIKIIKDIDYEQQSKYPVTVTMTSTDGSKKDTSFVISVKNVNEPVHVKDTAFTINENTKGVLGKVTAWDEDGDKIYYSLSDTINYSISDGKLTLNNPIDFETKKADTVWVYVEDDNNMKDSAKVVVSVKDVNEPLHIDSVKISVPENTPIKTVLDTIHGYDEDGEKITYTVIGDVIAVKDSVISLNKEIDYEKVKSIDVKVIASTSRDKDTITVHIVVTNVNEPVHVKDTTFTVPENSTGPIGKVNAYDEDGDKITYWVSDSTRYSVGPDGVVSIKVPLDYETQKKDSVIVYVSDPSGLKDSAVVRIDVKNEIEKSDVEIIATETRDSIWRSDTVYTNRPNVVIDWKADGKLLFTDTTVQRGTTPVAVCFKDPSKDAEACDTVVIKYSDAAPIVTVAKVDKSSTGVNGVTIVEEKDQDDKTVYVNTKLNDIEVTVRDTVTGETEKFQIKVELDTVKIPTKAYEKYTYVATTDVNKLKAEFVEPGKVKYTETIVTNGDTVKVSYYGTPDGEPLDTIQYVSYDKIVNGQKVTFSYTIDDLGVKTSDYEVTYTYTDPAGNDVQVSYTTDEKGTIQKNKDGGLGYKVSYTYTNKYGNSGTSEVFLALDIVPPKVKILTPIKNESYYTNSVPVVWTVDGIEQDTLNLERLEKGLNSVIRMYKDKYGNIGADTAYIFMKNAKDIEIKIINPVTEVDKDKVDEYYWKGNTYDPKKPVNVQIKNPNDDELPPTIGVGLKVNIVLPSVSSTGGLATIDDMVQTVNGKQGILVNKNGKLISGTSTGADGSYTIPVDQYISQHCNDEYKKEYNKNGLEHTTIWDVKYKMHIWIFNNSAEYVNDFNFEYTLDDTGLADEAGILVMVLDWLADEDGYVKSKDKNAIATGAYLTKLEATSISTTRCDLPEQPIGTKVKKDEYDFTSFGYKRPTGKR